MRVTCLVLITVFGGAALVLSGLGCGGGGAGPGGGGGVPPGPALFTGTYWYAGIMMEDGPPVVGMAQWGTPLADGAGGVTGAIFFNENGTPGGPVALAPGSAYTVGSDRAFGWLPGGTPMLGGGIAADGRVVAMGSDQVGTQPWIVILAKAEGTFALGSLDGPYHMCVFDYDLGGTVNQGFVGTMDFDSSLATCGGTFLLNAGGAITPSVALGGTYTVAANGGVGMTVSGAVWAGGLLQGSELAILGGSVNAGPPSFLVVLIRHSTAASLATLNGTYFIVGIERDGGGFNSNTGTAVADGAGNITATFTRNNDGAITPEPPSAATYTVALDGTLTVSPGPDTFQGGVSPTGNFATFGGGTNTGSNPMLFFMVR